MGADIHVFVQNKSEKTNHEWTTLKLYKKNLRTGEFEEAETNLESRDYNLFSFLAGVRGCYEPIDDLRGWPQENITPDVLDYMYYKDEDSEGRGEEWLHSYTWYDYTELKLFARTSEAEIWIDDIKKYNPVKRFVEDIDVILDAYWIWNPKPGEVRVLIAFDN